MKTEYTVRERELQEGERRKPEKERSRHKDQAMRYAKAQLYRRGAQNDCGMIGSEGCLLPPAAERDKECDWEVGLEVTGRWRQMY
jgi:hypothetical protein